MYDLIIIGGGPGGVAAGVYAARKKMKAAIIAREFGGQSVVSNEIQNWIGTPSISGFDLAQKLEEHLRAQEGIEVVDGDWAEKVEEMPDGLRVTTRSGKVLETKYLMVATGSRRRKLNVPGEQELDGKGVVYCSTCDAPLFKDKRVVVVGGGNAGLEAALDSIPYAAEITVLDRNPELKGDPITQEKIKADPKVRILPNAEISAILGEGAVTGLTYKDLVSGEEKKLAADGVFVEIGAVPNSDLAKGLAETNPAGEIKVDHATQRSSHPRIWAAGDVSDVLYKQNNISTGDAVKAVLNIYERLHKGG